MVMIPSNPFRTKHAFQWGVDIAMLNMKSTSGKLKVDVKDPVLRLLVAGAPLICPAATSRIGHGSKISIHHDHARAFEDR